MRRGWLAVLGTLSGLIVLAVFSGLVAAAALVIMALLTAVA